MTVASFVLLLGPVLVASAAAERSFAAGTFHDDVSSIVVPVGGGAGEAGRITLSIEGTTGVRYVGTCSVRTARGTEELVLGGVVPEMHRLEARGLHCEIRKKSRSGTLDVEVRKGANIVSKSVTTGPNAVISFSVQ